MWDPCFMRQGGRCSVCWEICLDKLMAEELTWEVSGWSRAKMLLMCGSWRACREFVLWQKNYLMGPRRRQQPNFFNAFSFTYFIWITAYHPALLCNQMKRWRHFGENFVSCLCLFLSTLDDLKSLVFLWSMEWFHLNFCFLFCMLVCCFLLIKIPCLVCICCFWQGVSSWCAKSPSSSWFWNTDVPVSVPLHKSEQGNCCLSTVCANLGSETEWCFC